ncbi:MAG: hypothetical protein WBV36_13035, partial [Terriglobales bacterium]
GSPVGWRGRLLWLLHFPALTDSTILAQTRGVNPASTKPASKVGFVLICLFGLPFAAFGVYALWQASR